MIRLHGVRAKPELGLNMRSVLAVLLAAAALGGAVFLGTVQLKMHGRYHCAPSTTSPGSCDLANSYWVVGRYVWQIPVAVVIGAVGLTAAFAVAKRK